MLPRVPGPQIESGRARSVRLSPVSAVLLAVMSAGVCLTACDDDDSPGAGPSPSHTADAGRRLIVPTSSYEVGDPGLAVGFSGLLTASEEGCVQLEDPASGAVTLLLFPDGYTAVVGEGEEFELLDQEGEEVAQEGQPVLASGASAEPDSFTITAGQECVDGFDEVAQAQAPVVPAE